MKNAVKVLIFVVAVVLIATGSVFAYLGFNKPSDFNFADGAKNDTIEVNEYSGSEKEIVIPEKYKGKTVTSLAAETFLRSDIVSVELPDTLTVIEEKAFYDAIDILSKGKELRKNMGDVSYKRVYPHFPGNVSVVLEKIYYKLLNG